MSKKETILERIKIAYDAIDDKQGEEITVIDIQGISVLADYFIIAHGNNTNHIQALIDNVDEKLSKAGYQAKSIEGTKNGGWILMDYTDFIIHIFGKQERLFYDLERIWLDGREVVDMKTV